MKTRHTSQRQSRASSRRGWFVLGPEVEAFETEFAAACGAPFAVGVGNGTDAITLALRALDIGPGDEVIVPAMTAAFTGLAVIACGAIPRIVDVEPDTLTIDPAACAAALTPRTKAIVPVHLYGQAADMTGDPRHRRPPRAGDRRRLLSGASGDGQGVPVGTRSHAGAFSFYPTKNLGALGDGGAVITSDASLAARLRRLRNGGQRDRYHHVEAGVNSRLDEAPGRRPARAVAAARGMDRAASRARIAVPHATARRRHHRFASAIPATCTISSRCA